MYVLERFLEPGSVVLTRQNVNDFSTALLKCLDTLGWGLSYDPQRLHDTIARAAEGLPEPAQGFDALVPERLVGS